MPETAKLVREEAAKAREEGRKRFEEETVRREAEEEAKRQEAAGRERRANLVRAGLANDFAEGRITYEELTARMDELEKVVQRVSGTQATVASDDQTLRGEDEQDGEEERPVVADEEDDADAMRVDEQIKEVDTVRVDKRKRAESGEKLEGTAKKVSLHFVIFVSLLILFVVRSVQRNDDAAGLRHRPKRFQVPEMQDRRPGLLLGRSDARRTSATKTRKGRREGSRRGTRGGEEGDEDVEKGVDR
jgi:hypothetical protein